MKEMIDCGLIQFIEADAGEYDIKIGDRVVGTLVPGEWTYILKYVITGGGLSGNGSADFRTLKGQMIICQHIFRLLADDLQDVIDEED